MRDIRWLVSLSVLGAALVIGGSSATAAACWISTTPLAFGNYNAVATTDLATTGTVHYWCSGNVGTRTVYLSKGVAGSNTPRQMSFGANRLSYNLYMDAAHSQIWGDPNPYSYKVTTSANNPDVTLTIYGLIPKGQDIAAGNYTDNITVTINF